MLDIATTKVYILEHKGTLYSESQINKVVKKIEKYRTTPVCDDETKAQYFLSVIEGIIAGKSLYLVQNAGCFRYSTFNAGLIFELARFLLTLKTELELSPSDIQFLEGIHHVKKIHDIEIQLTEKLRRELIQATKLCVVHGVQFSYIMTLCAYVEHLVAEDLKSPVQFDFSEEPKDEHKKELLDYGIEEIISALSFVISLYNEIPHMQELPNRVIAKQVATKRSQKILLLACKIRFLQELQQANEQFCYACCLEGNGELRLQSTKANMQILQDYRLGHIKRTLSNMNFKFDKEKTSFLEIIDHMRDLLKQDKVEDPPRYRLHIPKPIYEKLCTIQELTREEQGIIQFETDELNLNIDFYNKPIYKNLTLLEYIQLRRFFLVFFHAQIAPLYELHAAGEIDDDVYFQSLVPCWNKTIFDCLRSHFGDKLDDFWELNNYQDTNSKIIDLLYQPAIPGGPPNTNYANLVYPLCAIATISNIGRNLFALLKRFNANAVNEDGTVDPLINTLSKAFSAANIPHIYGKKLGDVSDIDFAFAIGSSVYVAECKRNTHPTDIFEARATIDAIHKAERQLDRIVNEFTKPETKMNFLRQFNLDLGENTKIVPFVITGNRIFSNTNDFRYPVRHFRELIRFVDEGTINIGGEEIYLRSGSGVSEADMINFLGSNSPYLESFINSMVKYQRIFDHGKTKIVIDDYALNAYKLDDYCRSTWGVSPLNPEFFEKEC